MGVGAEKLIEYKQELSDIIRSLDELEYHIRYDYRNVGNEQCADCVRSVINKCNSALDTLNSIDVNTLDNIKAEEERKKEEFFKAMKQLEEKKKQEKFFAELAKKKK